MSICQTVTWEGRQLRVHWVEPPTLPPRDLILQVSGVCCTAEGRIVLVAGADRQWGLPGGHPEPGETIESALEREVQEEACAVVRQVAYVGAQQVDDPANPSGPSRYYQLRYWARVELEPFVPRFETRARTVVVPSVFLETLTWGRSSPIAPVLLEAALAAEHRFAQGET